MGWILSPRWSPARAAGGEPGAAKLSLGQTMKAVSAKRAEDLDLHALRVFDVLFRERSLTRAADLMIIAIPTSLSNSD